MGRVWAPLLALCVFSACGARPVATLPVLRSTLDAVTPKTADQWARLGWLRYLDNDAEGAENAFERAPRNPLAALGRARLSQDRLTPRTSLTEAAVAASSQGRIGLIGRLWAEDAAKKIHDGSSLLSNALGSIEAQRQKVPILGSSAPISYLTYLDLTRLRDHPPREVDPQTLNALGQDWTLKPTAKHRPERLYLTRWDVPEGPVHVEIRLTGPMIVWRGDTLVAASARDRFSAAAVRFSAEGTGPLIMVWSSDTPPKTWLWSAPAPPLRVETDPLAAFLAIEQALLEGDSEWALQQLETAPKTGAFAIQRARAVSTEPGTPPRQRWDEAHGAWTTAASIAPSRSALALGEIELLRGENQGALKRLSALTARAPTSAAVHRLHSHALAAAGSNESALAALDVAARLGPGECVLLDTRAQLDAVGTRGELNTLVEAFLECGRRGDAAERLLDQERPEEAARILAKSGKGPRLDRLRAKAEIALGSTAEGRARLASLGAAATPQDRLRLGDLRLAAEKANRAEMVQKFIEAGPTAREALRFAATYPEWSPFATLRIDTEAAVAAYEDKPPMDGPAVRVLDHSALLFLGGDESVRWVHEILAIRSREAAETFGELGLPADAYPIAVFTRKADGRRLFAEDSPEKETLSLPDLSVGDYVVAIYLEPGDNGYLYDSGMLSPRVFFRGVDLPIFHQRFEVFSPDEVPLVVETKNGAPEPRTVKVGPRAGWRFDAREVPLRDAEPRSLPPSHWLPWARVGRGLEFYEALDYVRNEILGVRRRTNRFETWVRAHWKGDDQPSRLATLLRAIQDAVDGSAGLASREAVTAVETGTGNRALVTSTALETLGIEHELVVARPLVHDGGGAFSQPTDYVYPLIRLADGTWVDPGQPGAAVGFVPFVFLGGEGVILWPMDAPKSPIPLPSTRGMGDAREIRVDAHWQDDGVVRGRVVDRLSGQEGIVIGRYLQRLDEEVRPRLVERLFAGVFGAARVSDLVVDQSGGHLVLEYAFESQAGVETNIGLFPLRPGKNFAPLARRTTPLYIDLPSSQHLTFRLTTDQTLHTDAVSVRQSHENGAFLFDRKVDAGANVVEVETTLLIRGGVIPLDAYEPFGKWARGVDGNERIRVSRRP